MITLKDEEVLLLSVSYSESPSVSTFSTLFISTSKFSRVLSTSSSSSLWSFFVNEVLANSLELVRSKYLVKGLVKHNSFVVL